jgi:hypothetical protein
MQRRRFAPRSARTATRFLFVAVLALIAAAGATIAVAQATKPGITLQISPASQSVTRGQSAIYTVTATSTGGFTGSVALSVSGLPNSATAVFAPLSITLPSSNPTSTLTVSTTSSTSVSSYTLTVTGTSGKVSGSVQAGLTVNYPLSGSISMSAAPGSVTMAPGATAVYAITLARTNVAGAVTLTVNDGLPSHASATYSPNPTTSNSSALQIVSGTNTPEGTYTMHLVASGNDATNTTQYAYATVQLEISKVGKPFTISGNLSGQLAPGVSQPLNLMLTNPNNQAIAISNLTVTVQSVTRAASAGTRPCGVSDYAVTQYSGPYPLSVPANGSASLSSVGVAAELRPQVKMIDTATNQDGCKGATLNLAYSGSGQGS